MHVSRINPEECELMVAVDNNYYILPTAIDIDSSYVRQSKRANGEITERSINAQQYWTFTAQDFYKLGKQLSKW